MNQPNTKKLYDRFKFFHPERPPNHGLMCFGFECGDGWFQLIWDLCVAIEPLAQDGFEVVQVKEKYGGLRFYPGGAPEEVYTLIDAAEKASDTICENCGQPGVNQEIRRWWMTRCDECHEKRLRRDAERGS